MRGMPPGRKRTTHEGVALGTRVRLQLIEETLLLSLGQLKKRTGLRVRHGSRLAQTEGQIRRVNT